jgi:hypothetical protein
MLRCWKSVLLTAAVIAPFSVAPVTLRAQEHTYHDKEHNDDHQWNSHEDKAYRIWLKENHRKYSDFNRMKEEDQRSYWAWRHQHSDAELKINVR